MTDHIKRSTELDPWLKAQGIVVEPDEFAPVVTKQDFIGAESSVHVELAAVAKYRGLTVLCPYYGPGGSDNTLKALRAWCEKNSCYLALEDTQNGKAKWLLISENTVDVGGDHLEPPQPEPELILEGEGKTDGEALSVLLENLMEEKI